MAGLRLNVYYANSPLSCQAVEGKDHHLWCPGECSLVLGDCLSFNLGKLVSALVLYLHINCLLGVGQRGKMYCKVLSPIIL